MRRVLPVAVLLSLTLIVRSASAATQLLIRVDPIAPDSRTFVTLTLLGGCPGGPPSVGIAGDLISIDVPQGYCLAAGIALPIHAKVGFLSGGRWNVVVRLGQFPDTYRASFFVRGVDPLRAVPAGGPTRGGNLVCIKNGLDIPFDLSSPVTVTFGDQVITKVEVRADGSFIFDAPPHEAGDVDVMVSYQTAPNQWTQYSTRSAYRYTDAADDPYATEPLLFPIAYEGAGAYGSQWTTDNSIHVPGWASPGFASFMSAPCAGCPTTIEPQGIGGIFHRLDKTTSGAGVVLRVLRDTAVGILPASRIRDLSRQAQSAGVDIPVVRERDFRPLATLENIAIAGNVRTTLRVWSLDAATSSVQACVQGKFTAPTGAPVCVDLRFSTPTPTTLAFASADLTPILQSLTSADYVWVNVGDAFGSYFGQGRFWAMASITNNDTQEVTIVTPH